MHARAFKELSLKAINSYLERTWNAQRAGQIPLPLGAIILYPQILLCVETPGLHAVELVGSRRNFQPLAVKTHKAKTLDAYLGQVDTPGSTAAISLINTKNITFRGLPIREDSAVPELERRFPQLSTLRLAERGIRANGGDKILDLNRSNYTLIENCLIVHQRQSAVRIHDVLFLLVIDRSEKEQAYRAYLDKLFEPLIDRCVRAVPGDVEAYVATASSLASFYLRNQFRETTIGDFLNRHRDILLSAFGARDLVYEPYLEWQEGNPDESEKAINPDLLIERMDGMHDVCDLKLPLLNKSSLTKADRRRRRFIDSVQEGIAQLAHYEEYFQYPLNRAWAVERYGVRIDNPRKILIVGNYENINMDHVAEASRMLQEPYDIIDYDTLLQLYLAGKGVDTSNLQPPR